jgi:hypothetical protein
MFLVLTYQLIYIGEQNIEMDKAGSVNLREPRLYIKYHIRTHQYNPLYKQILWQGGMVLGCLLGPASILFITILSPLYCPYPSTISKGRMFTNGALTGCPNIERLHYRTCLITDDYLHFMYICKDFVPSAQISKPAPSNNTERDRRNPPSNPLPRAQPPRIRP